MGTPIVKKNTSALDHLLGALFLATVFLLAFNKIQDTDAWMHLSLGRLIWDLKGLPSKELFVYPNLTEPFSYTSWLFAVLFYVAFLVKGTLGVVSLQAIVLTVTFYVLLRDSLRKEKYHTVTIVILSLAALVALHRFVMRPDIFLMLFLAITSFLLNSFLYDNGKKGLYFLPLILFLWANIHSSVNLIVIPLGAFTLGSYLQSFFNKKGLSDAPFLTGSQIRFLLLIFGIALLVSLLNPNGIWQYLAGVQFIGADYYKQEVTELLPPQGSLKIRVIITSGLIALSFFLRPRKISIIHVLLVAPFAVLPFEAVRFTSLAAIVGAPIVARNIAGFCASRKPINHLIRTRHVKTFLALVLLSSAMMQVTDNIPLKEWLHPSISFGAEFDESLMPAGAVAFMNREKIDGRVLNPYAYGQYIIWTGYPNRQVFIDARGGVPRELLEMGTMYRENNQVLNALYEKYKFDSIIAPAREIFSNDPSMQGIDTAFTHPDWALVYWDDKSLVYLNRQGPYGEIIKKFEYKHFNADTTMQTFVNYFDENFDHTAFEKDLLRNSAETNSSKSRLFLGILYYYQSKEYQKAIDSLEQILPGRVENIYRNNAYATLGDIYLTIGDLDNSLYYFKKTPGNEDAAAIQHKIGVIMYNRGEIKKAIKHLEKAVKIDSTAPQAYSDLILAYEADGKKKKAAAAQKLYDALAGDQSAKIYFEKGAIAQQKQDLPTALAEYKRSLEINPSSPVVWTNLGFVYLDQNQLDKAKECFARAITLQKNNANAHYGLALVYKMDNSIDMAMQHFARYCELEPSGFFYREAKEQIVSMQATKTKQ